VIDEPLVRYGTVHVSRRAELSLGCLDGGMLMVEELSALQMLTKMLIFCCVQCSVFSVLQYSVLGAPL
jgi:hypothetical protein